VKHVERKTYDLVSFAVDIGGAAVALFRFLAVPVAMFSRIRLDSLMTNRLFYLSQAVKEEVKPNVTKHEKTRFGDIRTKIPRCMDLSYLRYTMCYCICAEQNVKMK
jgi:hypothetical protein